MAGKKRGPRQGRPEVSLRKNPERQESFLKNLEATGSLIESARRSSPASEKGALSTYKNFMRDDATFAAKVQEALDTFRDSLVREAVRRGRDGYKRPVFQKGELVGHEPVYSDGLLLAELRRHFPADYSEKHQHDHRHTVISPAGEWRISTEDISHLNSSEKADLARLMDRVREGRGERRAIEHQPSEIIDIEPHDEDEPEFAEFDLGYDA